MSIEIIQFIVLYSYVINKLSASDKPDQRIQDFFRSDEKYIHNRIKGGLTVRQTACLWFWHVFEWESRLCKTRRESIDNDRKRASHETREIIGILNVFSLKYVDPEFSDVQGSKSLNTSERS